MAFLLKACCPGYPTPRPVRLGTLWASTALLALTAAMAPAATPPIPASEIPLHGPYRYDRGWYHKVQMGDNLPVLATRFGVELTYLAKANGLKPDAFLIVGTYLYIPPHSGYYHKVKAGETLNSVAQRYHLDAAYLAATNRVAPTARLRPSEVLIIPTRMRPAPVSDPPGVSEPNPGSAGASRRSNAPPAARPFTAAPNSTFPSPRSTCPPSPSGFILGPTVSGYGSPPAANSGGSPQPRPAGQPQGATPDSSEPSEGRDPASPQPAASGKPGRWVRQPDLSSSPRASAPAGPARSPRRASDGRPSFQWPLEGSVTRKYVNGANQKHRGVDLSAPEGTRIRAAADGVVIYSGSDIPGYGNMVILDHGRGWATCYAHNSANLVRKDQRVEAGQGIAKVGATGHATGPHCHFEIRRNREAIDPMPLLP